MSPIISVLALLSIGGWPSPPRPQPVLRLALAMDGRLPRAVACVAVAEAAALWAPYRVAIGPPGPAPSGGPHDGLVDAALTVRVAEPTPGVIRAWSSPFASIRFQSDGVPEPTLLLHYDTLLTLGLGTVTVGGSREGRWPKALRDQILGRMIGRVLAHEIGHWLLRSSEHSAGGLMRASQPAHLLADPAREGFALTPADAATLRARYVGWNEPRRP